MSLDSGEYNFEIKMYLKLLKVCNVSTEPASEPEMISIENEILKQVNIEIIMKNFISIKQIFKNTF